MAPIYIMAIVATIVAVGLWGSLGAVMAGPHRRLLWLALLTIPSSALVNLLVKRPFLLAVMQAVGVPGTDGPPPFYWVCCLMGAPVSEEAIKALPVLFPPLLGRMRVKGAALWGGLFLGLGFGLGEIWFLAWSIAQVPDYAGMGWWQFTGFLNERVLVTLIHGVLTGIVVTGVARGGVQGWLSYLYAIGLHAFTNTGALLFQMEQIPLMPAALWIFVPFTLLVLIFMRMYHVNQRSDDRLETVLHRHPTSW